MRDKPIANPCYIYRQESDDCIILFDPETKKAYALDSVGGFLWRRLDGCNTVPRLVELLQLECEGELPEDILGHIQAFLVDLTAKGLVGYEVPIAE